VRLLSNLWDRLLDLCRREENRRNRLASTLMDDSVKDYRDVLGIAALVPAVLYAIDAYWFNGIYWNVSVQIMHRILSPP